MAGNHFRETPSQTAGPYVHIGTLPAAAGLRVRQRETPFSTGLSGETIVIEGTVRDGGGALVLDAMLEIWQARADSTFDTAGHRGFARSMTDFKTGMFHFETVKPGRVPNGEGNLQAPHISLLIFARGINLHLHTRIYFDDEEKANAVDPVLARIDDETARNTLLARRDRAATAATYRFDIILQGDGETVFFDI